MSSSERPRSARAPAPDGAGAGNAQDRGSAVPPAQPMPQPKLPLEEIPAHAARREQSPESSASGFVGMLAKGKLGSGDSHMPELLLSGEAGKPPARPKYQLRMAREVPPVRPAQAASVPAANASAKAGDAAGDAVGPPQREKAVRPRPSRVAAILLIVAALLLAAGLWAGGALVYMDVARPVAAGDVHYPLVRWHPAIEGSSEAAFTPASWMAAWSLLACLPLAGACIFGAARMRRRVAGNNGTATAGR